MSGHGAPKIQLDGAEGLAVAIVASSWHTEVMDGLVAGAEAALAEAGIEATLVRVAGSFELPVVAAQLAGTHDAVIALGVIIRRGTPHFDYVCAAATDGLSRVALDSGTPIGFGLLTCDDEEQAIARAGLAGSREDKGREATEAALSTAVTLRGLRA
ncbi:6,7-dimethyl-8-ribityllumazine synthase [Janibacter limosus]|uniref:6,7-dimethyl-8-ribityllumazine synthase n=1 Tax=Janibacter limosus TaxID=53458 RepID=UPI0035D9AC27|nr:6,7-dimethyl-8-ribityllumazine synthase [Janibacter limosus]